MINKKTKIIIDWDDTLFPTSWFIRNSINQLISVDKQLHNINIFPFNILNKVDSLISNILTMTINNGDISIITNASHMWILTCLKLLKKTAKLVKFYKIKIISTRNNNNLANNKIIFFRQEVDLKKYNNIISIGDSMQEYNALISLCKNSGKFYLKNVKLINYPDIDSILEQLKLLHNIIPKIVDTQDNLDLEFVQISN